MLPCVLHSVLRWELRLDMEQSLPVQDLVFTLLVRLGIASAIAALLARSRKFQTVLAEEQRSVNERLLFVLLYGPPVALGVFARLILDYKAADVSLEASLVAGLVGGRMTGMMIGAMAGLVSFLNGEAFSLPFMMACGAAGGILRDLCANKRQVWQFAPLTILTVPKMLWRTVVAAEGNWLLLPLIVTPALEFARIALGMAFAGQPELFFFGKLSGWQLLLTLLTALFATTLTLTIWNNTRIQIQLLDQEQVVLRSRMEALTRQINPHFLFNTLNTAVAMTRINPEMARDVLIKLSNILRRLLGRTESFVPLREELEFIDNYIDIELARFGPDKLRFHKDIDESTLAAYVPNMLLQPIVENAIRHGLSRRIEGGEIYIRTARLDNRIVIEVRDTGVGIPATRIGSIFDSGIGISNLRERLSVLYGKEFTFNIDSTEGQGTFIRIEIPDRTEA